MDSRRFIGDQQLNEQSKPPEECLCKGVANLGEDLLAHLKHAIGEEVEKALIRFLGPHLPLLQQRVLPPNSSMLPQQDKPSASRCLKLQFKGDLPATLFTMTKIEDHDVMLEVELLDKSDNRVDFGPESSLKIQIDVLDGDFDVEGRNDLTEEYTKNITPPRKSKGSLLKGNCEIKMSRGVASVSHIAFTDNSKSTRSEKYRLGAKILKGLPPGVVVMAAVSEAIRVKERRGKSAKLRNAKQSELPKLKTPTHQNSDQELTNLSIIQELSPQPPALLPPASWTSNVSGFGHSLDASSLPMGSIPPTNAYHDAAAANQACQIQELSLQPPALLPPASWTSNVSGFGHSLDASSLPMGSIPPTNAYHDAAAANQACQIQELSLQPPALLPPASWTSNVSGFGHSLDASSLPMGSIPPTNAYHDAAAANQACQIQELSLQPPALLPPASWTSNVSGFGHSLDASSLPMGSIPPTNAYHDAAAANQACQIQELSLQPPALLPPASWTSNVSGFGHSLDASSLPMGSIPPTNAYHDAAAANQACQIQELSLQPPALLPPASWTSNVSGFGHSLDASSLPMGSIPPTNAYHEAAAANQACQGYKQIIAQGGHFQNHGSMVNEDEGEMEAFLGMSMEETPVTTPLQEGRSNVTRKLISVFYMTKAATMFMISVQQDASVPKKKRKHQ